MMHDMVGDRIFWIPVLLAIVPTIIGAMAVSANTARLVPTIISAELKYIVLEKREDPAAASAKVNSQELSRDAAVVRLATEMRERLNRHLSFAFAGSSTEAAPIDVFADDLEKERLLSGIGLAQINLLLKVKNAGGTSGTIARISVALVEEIGGKRRPLENAHDVELDLKVDAHQTVQINPDGATKFFFVDSFYRFVDYEVVRFLNNNIAPMKNGGFDRAQVMQSYLQLLELQSKWRQEGLLTVAGPKKRARLILVVTVSDIFGRPSIAEWEILESSGERSRGLR